MRRAIIVAAMLALVCVVTESNPSGQNCNDCRPNRLNRGWEVREGPHTICFQSNQHHSWSETQRTQMESGFNWQKNLLASSGRNVSFTYTHAASGQNCSSTSIQVVALDFRTTTYPDQAGAAHGTSNGEGARIEINKDYVGGGPKPEHRWDYVAAHDFGHLVDLEDMHSPPFPAGCSGMSIMFFAQNPPPGDPCGDRMVLESRYRPQQPDACANGGCTPGYAPMGTPGCSEAAIDECGCCLTYSPIVLDLAANGVRFSSAENGPLFPINDMGKWFHVGWPIAADDVWLWLDRNDNGFVDNGSELFGNTTRLSNGHAASNGFVALAELDANADDMIDSADPAFAALQVWSDRNRDGVSQANEVSSLASTNVRGIELSYRESRRRDRHGNIFRYRSVLHLDGVRRRTWAWDVYPATAAPPTGADQSVSAISTADGRVGRAISQLCETSRRPLFPSTH